MPYTDRELGYYVVDMDIQLAFNTPSKFALVVDDEMTYRDPAASLLERAGFTIVEVANGQEALGAIDAIAPISVVLIDYKASTASGLQVISSLRRKLPDGLILLSTLNDDRDFIKAAFEAGVNLFLVKPYGLIELFHWLQEADVNVMQTQRRWLIDNFGPHPYRLTSWEAASAFHN
ncbi:MAG TPA: response regulator [Aggregatilineales bacterium]|nr:response regulator [Aggregatilineales bacterium]